MQFAETVTERTNGVLSITSYPSATLMSSADAVKELTRGTIQLNCAQSAYEAQILPMFEMLIVSLLGVTAEDIYNLSLPGTEIGSIYDKVLASANSKSLGQWTKGGSLGYVSIRPLSRAEDFQGVRVRTITASNAAVMTALKAEPTVMSTNEAVDAMRRDIIQAAAMEPRGLFTSGYVDFAKYYSPWVAVPMLFYIIVNLEAFDALPPDVQAILEEEAMAASVENYEEAAVIMNDAIRRLMLNTEIAILPVTDGERKKARLVAEPIYRNLAEGIGPEAVHVLDLLLAAEDK